MNAKDLKVIETKNAKQKTFDAIANETKGVKTVPANVKKTSKVETVNEPPTTMQTKSRANAYLKAKHNSLSSVLRTIDENFTAPVVNEFIERLKNQPTAIGKKQFPVIVSRDDFKFDVVKSLYQFATIDGKRYICKIAKVTEKTQPLHVNGNYCLEIGNEVNNEKETTVLFTIDKKGVKIDYTLKIMNEFSVWDIITRVVKQKKAGTFAALKEKAEKERLEKKAKRDAEKAAEREKREKEKAAKKAEKEQQKAA